MVHDDADITLPSGSKFKQPSASTDDAFDVKLAINRLVDAVEFSVSNYKPQDRAQMFGDQFACFLRGLNDIEFYDATIYASTYMKNVTEKQIAAKLTNP